METRKALRFYLYLIGWTICPCFVDKNVMEAAKQANRTKKQKDFCKNLDEKLRKT